jgi:hypothetical protein
MNDQTVMSLLGREVYAAVEVDARVANAELADEVAGAFTATSRSMSW